jgi:hypothetical protein
MDQETSESVQKQIQAHLAACADCRQFEKALREKVSQPFKGIEEVRPPEEVWHKIQEAIEEEEQAQYAPAFLERLWDFLRNSFPVRRPAFAFSTVISVIIVAVLLLQLPFQKQRLIKDYLQEQSEFMLSLNNPVNGDSEQDFSFNTAVEQYFF